MPGDIRAKERAIATLTTTGASLSTGSAALANATADFDARAGGNAPDDSRAQFELVCQWATITGIVLNTVVAELYLVPLFGGVDLPDVDLTAGSSVLPLPAFAGVFRCTKAPIAATNMRFISDTVQFNPFLCRPYLLNRSGQTMTVNWAIRVMSVQDQYT